MAVVMNAGSACRTVHIASGVIHGQVRRVDEMGTDFVGKSLSVLSTGPHHRLYRAPALTAAGLASPAAGGGAE
jgi:hypothetical protein